MAGSSTQSEENFTPQGMERHPMMVNAEMTKHLKITNRASVREIMLQHEKTFKEQVHDLHKLYEVQRLLMDKAKSGGRDAYTGGLPPSPFCGYAVPEESNQRTNFWTHASTDGMGTAGKGGGMSTHPFGSPPMAILEGTSKVEEAPKNVSSPVRKRKIDLEQLPEDDSDDEMENSANIPNPTTAGLSRNLEELPKVYSGFDAPVKQGPCSQSVSSLQLFPPTMKPSETSSLVSRDVDMSGRDNCVKVLPILSQNVSKTEENLCTFGERNTSIQTADMLMSGVTTQTNNSMFLPQADLIDRASQETAHWFLQASEPKIVDTSVMLPAQQQQRLSPHLVLPDQPTSRGNPSTPHLDQPHHINNPLRIESVGSSMSKVSLERHSSGGHAGAQKDTSNASAERLGSSSKWFSKESTLQALPTNVVPVARFETGVMPEGGHGLPGIIAPPSNNGFGQERESLWASKNPVLQAPLFQQPPIFQQQIAPPAGQSLWVQSSHNAQNSIFSQQQVMYGYHHSSKPPPTDCRGESLQQRNPGDVAGPWNMIGLGHFYSSVPSTPQKPPFKKPPKLVLKNDGVGMELKLVSPEKEMSEKDRALQKKPLSVLKRDALQASSKSRDNSSGVQKQAGEEDTKLSKRITEISNFTGEAKGLLKSACVPIEPTLPATDSSSSTLSLSPGASTCVTLPCSAPLNLGALACSSGSETGSGFHVSTSTNKSMPQHCVPQMEMVLPESEKIAEQRVWNVKTSKISLEEESLPLNNVGHGQMEGSSLLKGEIYGNAGSGIVEEKKNSSNKKGTSEGNAIDGVASSQSVSVNTTPEVVKSKCVEKAVVPQRAQKLDDIKGGLSQGCANVESYQKEVSESKASRNGVLTYPADQFVMQAISVQSTSTDTPSNSRQEKKRFSSSSEKDMLQGASGRIFNESRSPQSDRDCVSAPSSATSLLEAKVKALVGDSNDDFQHDSDSDNLAATILLSFAPKMGLLNEEKQSKDSTSEISSSIRKVKSAEHGSKRSRPSEARTGSRPAGSQTQKMQNPKRVDPLDQHDRSKLTIKDRHRREEMNHADQRIGEGDIVVKSFTVKLPRVASSTSHEGAIPLSRSKELSKLNGASLSGHPVESSKIIHRGNEVVHTPTGRRSSRGPPMAGRAPLESRSRLQQQTHLSSPQSSPQPADKDSAIREKEGGRSITKLEGNMKSKAWGELNRTRSHPRRQVPETLNRKSQK